MSVTYYKRYRMEYDLRAPLFACPQLPAGYRLLPWRESLLKAHATAKYLSFRYEIDANVFPCLGSRDGCYRLMSEITQRSGFLPETTWLVGWQPPPGGRRIQYCGTVQGMRERDGFGSIQNLGVIPEHRGQGLGTILLYQALHGFAELGMTRASLEVTAQNRGAVRLYKRLGFRTVKTVYKSVELVYA